jgi:phosphatidylethanolamine-binding protein (PEBP) family uncharacterized protein
MTLKSSAFAPQTQIPNRFTCDGPDVSPALSWSNIQQNTKSLALIVEDPDVPIPAIPIITWGHWLYMDSSRFASISLHQAKGTTAHVYPACY